MLRIRLAIMNLMRGKRRSLFAVFNVTASVTVILLIEGFGESMYQGMEDNMVHSRLGHIQIFSEGYEELGQLQSSDIRLPGSQVESLLTLLENDPEVVIATPRLTASVMASSGARSQAGGVIGINPDREAVISTAIKVIEGRELFEEDESGILIGAGLAKSLNIKTGELLTLLATTVDEAFNAVDLEVIGIVSTSIREVDARLMMTNIAVVETLLNANGASNIVVLLENGDDLDEYAENLKLRQTRE